MAQGLIYSIHSSALVEFLWKAYYSPLLDHGKEVGVGKDMDRQERLSILGAKSTAFASRASVTSFTRSRQSVGTTCDAWER